MGKLQKLSQFLLNLILLTLTASCSVEVAKSDKDLAGTIESQNTQLAKLETQVVGLEDENWNQQNQLSYLFTQMPYALGWFTPIPPGITLTPTPFSSGDTGGPTYTPTPWLDQEYPPDMRSGIPEVNKVIDAFMLGSLEDRLTLVRYSVSGCTTSDGLGGPPKCEPDEPEDSPIAAFPVSSGEGVQIRPENIKSVFDFTVRGLFAVYLVPDEPFERAYWPAGDYGIVFTSEDGPGPHFIVVLVEDGEIVRLDFPPGLTQDDLFAGKILQFIIPPSTHGEQTPFPVCTPPACAPDEDYYCPGVCPGGCGTTCATSTPGESLGTGHVMGRICSAENETFPLALYFQETRTLEFQSIDIPPGKETFEFELPAGIYVAFAWLTDQSIAGSYSQYVLCGQGQNCEDHSLVHFLVQENRVATGIDICDWSGDTGGIPEVPVR